MVDSGIGFQLRSPAKLQRTNDAIVAGNTATDTRAATAAPRLDPLVYNRTIQTASYRLVGFSKRCKCRTCPSCGPRKGWLLRQLLLEIAQEFRCPALLTLTVNRDEFTSPQAAHAYISEKGCIRLLLRRLGLVMWVWVLEFQQKTGDGWPHWHILIDLADVPGRRIDLERAWAFWRDKWKIGGLDLQLRRNFKDASKAIKYITKYLLKQPLEGYPLWVLESEKRIRLFQGSGAMGALVNRHVEVKKQEEAEKREKTKVISIRAKPRTLARRMAECGQHTVVMLETSFRGEDEKKYQHLRALAIRPERLAALSSLGRIDADIKIEIVTFDGEPEQVYLRPFVPLEYPTLALKQIEKIEGAILNLQEPERTQAQIDQREEAIKKRARNYGKLKEGEEGNE